MVMTNNFTLKPLLIWSLLLLSVVGKAQVTVTPSASAATLASTLAGPGLTVLNPTDTCLGIAEGTFISSGTLLSMSNGILLTNGHATAVSGAEGPLVDYINGTAGDPSVAYLLPSSINTYDACILTFDVVATGDTLSFNYQFGSEEYRNAVCSDYTDVFAFFISGPGITGQPNIAMVPGTNIPVEINSINDGSPGSVGGAKLSNCTSLGAGSPFTAYYLDNTHGSYLTYRGFTDKLRAYHSVTPCDTYHLKLTIVDAGNARYDSGVFLEGGSLTTGNKYHFDHTSAIGTTIDSTPSTIIRGCNPGTITVVSSDTTGLAQTIHFTYGGTAVLGTDYTATPLDSITIPAYDTTASFNIQALSTASGAKTVVIYLNSPNSCGALDSIVVNIADAPTARIVTPDTCISLGDSATIVATGTPGLSYSWSPATGLSSTTVMDPVVTPTAVTTYTMTATLPGTGCPPITGTISIGIGQAPDTLSLTDTTICLGASFTIPVSGSNTLTYSWAPASGLSSASVKDPVASPTVTTTYTLTITGASGCTAPGGQTITIAVVNPNFTVLNHDTTICPGATVNLALSGNVAYSYVWNPDSNISSTTSMTPSVTPLTTTTYTVYDTIPGMPGCSDTGKVTVKVVNMITNHSYPDTTICLGNTLHFASPVADTAGISITWSPGTYLNDSTIADPVTKPDTTITYIVTASAGICSASDTVTVTVNFDSIAILTPDTAICVGQSVMVNAISTPGGTYQWTPTAGIAVSTVLDAIITPDTSATYVLSATFGSCRPPFTDSFHIDVQPIPSIYLGGNRNTCQFDTLHLEPYIVPGNYAHYSYLWSPAGLVDYDTAPVVVFHSDTSAMVYLTVTTPVGCTGIDSSYITVYPNNFANLLPGNFSICPGDSVQLVDTGGAFVHWYPSMYLGDSLSTSPWVYPLTTQSYSVVATSIHGCLDTNYVTITVFPGAEMDLVDSVRLYPGETYHITPTTNCLYFSWFPTLGLTDPTISDPVASPDVNTKYFVHASTENGCQLVDSIDVFVDPGTLLAVPNAFTPGNGPNSILYVIKRGEATLDYFHIYNRWGNEVFSTTNIEVGWDGSFNGKPQPEDVYVFVVEARTNTGKRFYKQGNVTLLR
jgi:gliding motility-associated-like protein